MSDQNKILSRRSFLNFGNIKGKQDGSKQEPSTEMVKMLTPEGQLVEVDRKIMDQLASKKKASNKEIYDWMNNPSKE